jgi:hypothetical protein
MPNRPHHPECLCEHCERTGSGYFAQRAALDGDTTTAHRLSPVIYGFLAAKRARRVSAKSRAVAAYSHNELEARSAAR